MIQGCCLISVSPEQTREVGRILGSLLEKPVAIFLIGEMGGGKTCFTQGIGAGIGGAAGLRVTSPSYTLMNFYPGPIDLYHFDLFRLGGGEDLEDIGFAEYLRKNGVVVVEWADRIEYSGYDGLCIHFEYLSETRRKLTFSALGLPGEKLLRRFCREVEGRVETLPGVFPGAVCEEQDDTV